MSKAARQQSARERMREERRRQQARQRTMRRVLIPAAVVIVIAAAVGIGVFVQSQRAAGGDAKPVSIAVGKGKPVVHVYEDFQCPACRQFEQMSGDMLTSLAQQGEAKIVYHPVSIFQGVLQERSLRAASAAMCAADQGKFQAYHALLFRKQPPESKPPGTDAPPEGDVPVNRLRGFENWKLIEYGEKVGLTGSEFAQCVKSDKYQSRIKNYTQNVIASGKISSTPTLYLGDQRIPQRLYFNPSALEQRILSAGQQSAERK